MDKEDKPLQANDEPLQVNFVQEFNKLDKKTKAALIAGGAVFAVGGAVVAVPLIGFTTGGVGAGTAAAAWQATIGNVAAGSLFASFQSAGVLGLATTTKVGLAAAGAGSGYVAGELIDIGVGAINKIYNNNWQETISSVQEKIPSMPSAGVGLASAMKAGVAATGSVGVSAINKVYNNNWQDTIGSVQEKIPSMPSAGVGLASAVKAGVAATGAVGVSAINKVYNNNWQDTGSTGAAVSSTTMKVGGAATGAVASGIKKLWNYNKPKEG